MKKWAISAVVYLFVVTGGYYAFSSITGNEPEEHNAVTEHIENNGNENHEEGHSDHEDDPVKGDGEVLPEIHEDNGKIVITLKDQEGNKVSDLKVSHEKLMHLIVVSKDLNVYKHLHPITREPGVFMVEHGLEEGEYNIFVDIKPKNLTYVVEPIEFKFGNQHDGHEHETLQPDTQLVKEVGEHQVTLQPSSLNANEEIQLKFDLHGDTPEPYLGALGHVVILDEKAEKYIHVHPLEGNEPVFETKFTEPGVYKIWSEFQFNGEVFVFPYVVEIK